MSQVLLCPDPKRVPHWFEAFPDGEVFEHWSSRISETGMLWIHTDTPEWPQLVSTRSATGQAVVVVSGVPTAADLRQALTAGARGFEHAWSPADLLRQVATVVKNGGIWVGPELMSALIKLGGQVGNNQAESNSSMDWSLLSAREREVVEVVATGASNKEIARLLNITERTVKAHLSAIFQKLGVRDRLHLALALRQ